MAKINQNFDKDKIWFFYKETNWFLIELEFNRDKIWFLIKIEFEFWWR